MIAVACAALTAASITALAFCYLASRHLRWLTACSARPVNADDAAS